MWRVLLSGVTRRKRRFVSTVVAIVVAVGFLTAVSTLSDSVRGTFDSLFTSVYGRTDVVVTARGTLKLGFRRAPQRLARVTMLRLTGIEGLDAIDGVTVGYAQLVGRNGTPIGGSNSLTFGSAWTEDHRFNPFEVVKGRAPTADDEIVVDRISARLGDIALGDRVHVLTASAPEDVTVVGYTRFGRADSPGGLGYLHFTAATADRLFQADSRIDQILAVAKPGVDSEVLKARVEDALGHDPAYDVFTGREASAVRQTEFQKRLAGFTVFLTVFALIALFVSVFVIVNTFQILLTQRQRELALLRAIGAGRYQILRGVLGEATMVGSLATAIGVGSGLVVAAVTKRAMAGAGIPLTVGPLLVTGSTMLRASASGVLTTVAAATVPAWHASRIAPVAAMAQTAVEADGIGVPRVATGCSLALAAAGAVGFGVRTDGADALVGVGAAGALAVVALLLLDPVLLAPFPRLAGFGVHGTDVVARLARQNVLRSPRRNALTAFPLLFGAALVGLLLVFTASFQRQIDETIDGQFKGDLFVSARSGALGFSTDVAAAVNQLDGIAALTPVRFMFVDPRLVDGRGRSEATGIIGVDTATVLETIDVPVLAGSIRTMTLGTVAIGSELATRNQWRVGDRIAVEVRGNPRTPLTIAAIIDTAKVAGLLRGAGALVGLDTFDGIDPTRLDQALYVRTTDRSRAATTDAERRINAALASYPTVEVGNLASYKRVIDRQVAPFLAFMFALLAISVVIAMIGVANTMKLSVAERTRELGLLRAIGMDRRQARTMVRWEAVTISVFGVTVGSVLGAGFGLAMMRALHRNGFTEAVVPPGRFAMMSGMAVVLGLLAASGAARRVSKLNVLQAISVE